MARPKAETPTYSLTQRTGHWYIQWWDSASGRARRVSCRTTSATRAKRFLAEFRAGASTDLIPEAPTIGAILDGYTADREKRRHSATLQYDVAALKRHLEHLPVDRMNGAQSEAYCSARRTEPPRSASAKYRLNPIPLSDGTLIRELGTLRTALTWAHREKWIAEKPDVRRPPTPPARQRWLTHKEYDRLLRESKAPHVRLFIALALYTGARMGALLELTWDRVDLQTDLIDLGTGRGLKNRARVPITAELHIELQRAADLATSPYVVEHGGQRVATVKAGIRATAERAELPWVTAHVFRHTAATWMVQRNVPVGTIAKFLGNTEAMIDKVYGHHSPEFLKVAADALSRPMAERTK